MKAMKDIGDGTSDALGVVKAMTIGSGPETRQLRTSFNWSLEEGSETHQIHLDAAERHKLSWARPITHAFEDGETATLEPGECYMYSYPRVIFTDASVKSRDGKSYPVMLKGRKLELLQRIVRDIGRDAREGHDGTSELLLTDKSGASMVHALCIANTQPALECMMGPSRRGRRRWSPSTARASSRASRCCTSWRSTNARTS